jgi:hypothetical protein
MSLPLNRYGRADGTIRFERDGRPGAGDKSDAAGDEASRWGEPRRGADREPRRLWPTSGGPGTGL